MHEENELAPPSKTTVDLVPVSIVETFNPRMFVYSLTELGQSLEPIIEELMSWGAILQELRGIPDIEAGRELCKPKTKEAIALLKKTRS